MIFKSSLTKMAGFALLIISKTIAVVFLQKASILFKNFLFCFKSVKILQSKPEIPALSKAFASSFNSLVIISSS